LVSEEEEKEEEEEGEEDEEEEEEDEPDANSDVNISNEDSGCRMCRIFLNFRYLSMCCKNSIFNSVSVTVPSMSHIKLRI
jgi:hypothetical protein